MADDTPRSARARKRRSDGAPAWWSALDRADLPGDRGEVQQSPQWYSDGGSEQRLRDVPGVEGVPSRRRTWLINIAVVAVAIVLITVGIGVRSPHEVLTVGLLFGVPILLVALTATIVARRIR